MIYNFQVKWIRAMLMCLRSFLFQDDNYWTFSVLHQVLCVNTCAPLSLYPQQFSVPFISVLLSPLLDVKFAIAKDKLHACRQLVKKIAVLKFLT